MASHTSLPIRGTIQIRIEKAVVEVQMLQQAISSQANQEAATMPIEITPLGSPLQRKFEALVMCNFTPRKPSTLPVSRWVSCANTAARTGDYRPAPHLSLLNPLIRVCLSCPASDRRLYLLFHPLAPTDVWSKGPGNLKQLITEWYKAHPAFAGSVEWCKRVKNTDPQDNSGQHCYKFCFEYTPNGARAPNGRK